MIDERLSPAFRGEGPADARPRLAVVVPVFKHSGLVREAIYSLARQPGFADVDVVLVDDGCPDPQTYATLTFLAARWSNLHYVRQANSGLSAARNRGIEFTLRALPEAQGIYFLDADNMLAPYSIAAMQEALVALPDADWFYPDIRMFGLRLFNDYSGSFNAYAASVVNLCEAGSLVRRRMIETDLRFDEDMRLGYEDWDFWLSAIERGFRGRHLPALGLSYRKRAESMLADSTRADQQIRDYLRRKHEHLFQINAFVELEHNELPRFALVRSDAKTVELATDLDRAGTTMSLAEFATRQWQAIREPSFAWAGQYLLTAGEPVIEALRRAGLLHWLSLEIEQLLAEHNFVSVVLAPSADETIRVRRGLDFSPRCHLIAAPKALLQAILSDERDDWIVKLPSEGASYRIASLEVSIPAELLGSEQPREQAAADFVQLCLDLRRSPMARRPDNVVTDIFLGARPLDAMLARARVQFENALLPPIASPRHGRIAFVLPVSDFGGVEKVTFCLSHELRRLGFSTTLILLGRDEVRRATSAADAFDDIYVLDPRGRAAAWAGASFFGTRLPEITDQPWGRDLSNLLATFELVVSCHSAEVLPLLSGLRRREVATASYLHLFDKSEIGGYLGHPTLALAYEHALDLVLTCSDALAADMAGLGIPRAKILALPNAPSFHPTLEGTARSEGPRQGPVRVLYLGRLDAQKGLDRLSAIFDAIGQDADFEIRVVGKAVMSSDPRLLGPYRHRVEPPIYDDAGLAEVFRWADVLLLPSRYEGLPLTVLEAMAHGVVPIAADCGALAEAIDHDVTGFLVPQGRCAELSVEHLRRLASDRALLRRMGEAAAAQVARRTWRVLAERLRDRLEALRRERAKTRAERAAAKRAASASGRASEPKRAAG